MKKLICLLLTLSFVLGLSACTLEERLEVWMSEVLPQTEAPTETIDPNPPVVAGAQQDYIPEEGYMPTVYTYRSDTVKDGGRSCSFKIPAIKMPGPNVEAINREIQQSWLKMTKPFTGGAEAALPYERIDYKWAVKGDVLSLVIMAWGAPDSPKISGYGYNLCSVYNVSVTKCRLLTNEEVYAAAGLSNAQTHVKCAVAARSGEWYLEGGHRSQIFSEENKTLTLDAFSQSLSRTRFEAAAPYFDEHDQLCIIADICDPITQQRFSADICLDDYRNDGFYSAEKYYDYYAALSG